MKFVQRFELPASATKIIRKIALRIDPKAEIDYSDVGMEQVTSGKFGIATATMVAKGDHLTVESVIDLNELMVVRALSGVYKIVDGAMELKALVDELSDDDTFDMNEKKDDTIQPMYQKVG